MLTWDIGIVQWIAQNLNQDGFIFWMRLISGFGDAGLIRLFIALLLFARGARREALYLLCALALATLAGELTLKNLIGRQRPFLALDLLSRTLHTTHGYSFPSGHTTSSFAAASYLAAVRPRYRGVFLSMAAAIGLSRIGLLVHFPSDVLAGALLGSACGLFVARLYHRAWPGKTGR